MKNTTCVAVLVTALFQIVFSANLRTHNDTAHFVKDRMVASQTSILTFDTKSVNTELNGLHCLQREVASNETALNNGTRLKTLAKQSKLRVCNAVTTERDALITVWLNGKELTEEALTQRKCAEFIVQVSTVNKFEVKLSGEVRADWSGEKSADEMNDIPVLFLVAHIFGEYEGTTFSVDEFHGENDGLKSVQLAYMDVFRADPDASLRISSPGGEFEMRGGTYISICAGKYSLSFRRDGQTIGHVSDPANFKVGEQYIVLRIAPDKKNKDDTSTSSTATETPIIYPQSSPPHPSMKELIR